MSTMMGGRNNSGSAGTGSIGATPSMDVNKWDATPRTGSNSSGRGGANTFMGGQTPLIVGGSGEGVGGATAMANSAGNFGATPMVTFAGDGGAGMSSTAPFHQLQQRQQQQDSRFGHVDAAMLAALQQQQAFGAYGGGAAGDASSMKQNIAEDFARLTRTDQQMVVKMLEARRYISDAQLDDMIPPGYSVVEPPASYLASAASANNADINQIMMTNDRRQQQQQQQDGSSQQSKDLLGTTDSAASLVDSALKESKNRIGGRLDLPADGVISEDLPPMNVEDIVIFELLIEYKGMLDSEIPLAHVKKVQVLRSLLKFKNGKPTQRRTGFKDLTTRARYYGVDILIPPIVDLWRSEGVIQDEVDRHRIVKLLGHLLLQFRGILPPHQVRDVLVLVQPLLHDHDVYTRQEGREVMASLIKAAGFEEMVKAIRGDMESDREETRRAAAQTICVIAETLGFEASGVMKLLDVLCRARKSWCIRHTGARAIAEIVASPRIGVAVCRRFVQPLVNACVECLRFENGRVRSQAAHALGVLAETVRPFGFEAFIPALSLLREQVASIRHKGLLSFLRAVGSIMVLMPAREAREQATVLTDQLQRCFANPDDEYRRAALHVVDQVLAHDGITPEFAKESLLVGFLNAWSIHSFVDRRNVRQLLETTGNFAKKVAGTLILAHLRERLEQDVPTLPSPNHIFVKSVADGIRIIIEKAPFTITAASDEEVRLILDALLETLNRDREGACNFLEDTIAALVREIGYRFAPLAPKLVRTISARLGDRHLRIRTQAAFLLSKTVKSIGDTARLSIDSLRDAWTVLDEKIIKEHSPALVSGVTSDVESATLADKVEVGTAISAGMRACSLTLEVWCSYDRYKTPALLMEAVEHVKKLLNAVALALKSPLFKHNDAVQEQCVRTVLAIIELSDKDIAVASPDDLYNVAVESLLLLLHANRRQTRTLTTQAFGKVANLIGPLQIIKKLIERGLRRDDPTYRKCAAIALAVVARYCRPFVVVPFLIFEYEQSKGTELAVKIQHSVLKCVRFIFEFVAGDTDAVLCVHALLPLLERALTERELQHRRLACEAVREMILACGGGLDNEGQMRGVWLHLLNFVVPTLLEPIATGKEQRKAVSSVVEVFEAARLVLPAGYLLQLLEQGMFHPARFVRDVYWNTFNTIAVGAGEQLVAYYPSIHDDREENEAQTSGHSTGRYRRSILEAIV